MPEWITAVVTSTITTAIFTTMIEVAFKNKAAKDLAKYRHEMEHKADIAIARLESSLRSEAFQKRRKFETRHAREAVIVRNAHTKITSLFEDIKYAAIQWGSLSKEEHDAAVAELFGKIRELNRYLLVNRLYLPDDIAEGVLAQIRVQSVRVARISIETAKKFTTIEDFDQYDVDIAQLSADLEAAMKQLRAEFQRLIG